MNRTLEKRKIRKNNPAYLCVYLFYCISGLYTYIHSSYMHTHAFFYAIMSRLHAYGHTYLSYDGYDKMKKKRTHNWELEHTRLYYKSNIGAVLLHNVYSSLVLCCMLPWDTCQHIQQRHELRQCIYTLYICRHTCYAMYVCKLVCICMFECTRVCLYAHTRSLSLLFCGSRAAGIWL